VTPNRAKCGRCERCLEWHGPPSADKAQCPYCSSRMSRTTGACKFERIQQTPRTYHHEPQLIESDHEFFLREIEHKREVMRELEEEYVDMRISEELGK